jgi:flagellar hook-associated protein 3 FlgL
MRVTGNSFTNTLLNQLNLLNARQYRLQNQAATGQRIQAPEDDPAGMAQALNLQTETSRISQYEKTIATLQDRASASYNVLQQLKTISDRISEICVQANDGTKSAEDLQNYAREVTQLTLQAAQLMNTKQGDEYLFGGTSTGHPVGTASEGQPPYQVTTDPNGNVSTVTYYGNSSVAEKEIAEGATVAVDVPGLNNSGSGPRGVITDSRFKADFFNHLISLQNHLQAGDANAVATVDQASLLYDENNIVYSVATNGAMQSRLDAEASIMGNRKAALQTSLANVAGADLTQTLVQLSQTQSAYQAALQTSSNILQLQQSLLSALP